MLKLEFWRSAYDDALDRPKTAFPTRYHYIEVLRNDLAACGVSVSRLGQHNLVLKDRAGGEELIVVVRYTTDRDLELVAGRKQKHGARVAYLIDDDYWAMLEDEGLLPNYRARLGQFLTRHFSQLYTLLDAVVAPSRQILARFPELNGVHMQPAHLSPPGDLAHFDNPERIKLIFLGTSTHSTDFRQVAPGIQAALKTNPFLHLTTLLGKRGEELIPSGDQVTHMTNMFFPRFQRWLTAQRFHIGLAPYEPNPVNDGRSNLKFHQHALVGAAGLYSKTKPFLECVETGVDGLLLDYEPCVWRDNILSLSQDADRIYTFSNSGIHKCRMFGSHHVNVEQWKGLLLDR